MIRFFKFFLFIISIFPSISFSQNLVVDITEGNVEPLPIALQSFVSKGNAGDLGENILRVISNDLVSTGLFNVIDKQAYIEKSSYEDIGDLFAEKLYNNLSEENSGDDKMLEIEFDPLCRLTLR